jgi:hypothetical protein
MSNNSITTRKAIYILIGDLREGEQYTIPQMMPQLRYLTGNWGLMDSTAGRKLRYLKEDGKINYRHIGKGRYVALPVVDVVVTNKPIKPELSVGDIGYLLYLSLSVTKDLNYGNVMRIYKRNKQLLPLHWQRMITNLFNERPYDEQREITG